MASLDKLNIELLTLICSFVEGDSPHSIKSLAAVNRVLHATTKLVAHRQKTIVLDPEESRTHSRLAAWLADEDVLRSLRHLTVKSERTNVERRRPLEGRDLAALVSVLERSKNLTLLSWSCAETIPAPLIQALEKFQKKAELKVWDWRRGDPSLGDDDKHEIALTKSPALTLLRGVIWADGYEPRPDLRQAAFRRIVASAPNLKQVTVICGRPWLMHNNLTPDEEAQLERCERKFSDPLQKPSQSLRKLTLDGYSISEQTLQTWSRFVDLAYLDSFQCSRGLLSETFFKAAPEILSNLKHLSLNLGQFEQTDGLRAAAVNYIGKCAPLQSLSLWSWAAMVPLSVILSQHGTTLEVMQLRERETTASGPRYVLSVEEVKRIQEQCPKLKELTMDVNRKRQSLSPSDHEKLISQFARMNLTRLQLYFDGGLRYIYEDHDSDLESVSSLSEDESVGTEEDIDDRLDSDSSSDLDSDRPIPPSKHDSIKPFIEKVWKQIFGSKSMGDRSLDVKFGEWEQKQRPQQPGHRPRNENADPSFWQVRPAERDDQQGECTIKKIASVH